MNILWFTWRDITHPLAGGAEAQSSAHCKYLAAHGHTVTVLTSRYAGAKQISLLDGYKIIRVGNRYTVYVAAAIYYLRHLRSWPKIIIEEVNTVPFLTQWYTHPKKRFLYIYQLSRQIWFHEIFFPINIIGYLVEPIYLWIMRKNYVFTESQSTKEDLLRFGFKNDRIHIIPIGISQEKKLTSDKVIGSQTKYKKPTILSFGAVRSMKRTLDQVRAFEIAKQSIPKLQMTICGDTPWQYGKIVLRYIKNSPYTNDIQYLGRVDKKTKIDVMNHSHLILVTSVKEGWGMIVTEAGLHGTPAIVYDVDGLRDTVIDSKTGIIVKSNTPRALSKKIVNTLADKAKYNQLRQNAIRHSKKFTYNKASKKLLSFISHPSS